MLPRPELLLTSAEVALAFSLAPYAKRLFAFLFHLGTA